MKHQLVQIGNGAHALATQIMGNPEDAADAVQDAFTKVLSKPESYNPASGAFKPWFFRVVRNRCIDLIRRRRPQNSLIDELQDTGPGPEGLLMVQQRDKALYAALSRLKPAQRQIIVLRDYTGLSYAEIAQVLDVANGTVMSKLHRARMALKQELEIDEC